MTNRFAALIALLILHVPNTANAILVQVGAYGSLTKVAENTYDFSYQVGFGDVIPPAKFPTSGYDPTIGLYAYYYVDPRGGIVSSVSGEFGLATDLLGEGTGAYGGLNYYGAHGFGGAFRITQAPEGVFSVYANEGILVEYYFPNGGFAGRNLVGSVEGDTALFGDIPTGIGQTTQWTVTPEPATWLLLGIGLVPVLKFRPRRRT